MRFKTFFRITIPVGVGVIGAIKFDYIQLRRDDTIFNDGQLLSVYTFVRHGNRTPGRNIHKSELNLWKNKISKNYYPMYLSDNNSTYKWESISKRLNNSNIISRIDNWDKNSKLIDINDMYSQVSTRDSSEKYYQGALTYKGVDQGIEFGKYLRERYRDYYGFLGSTHDTNDIYFRCQSTNVMRTIFTADAVLNGLFGSNKITPIHVDRPGTTILTPNWKDCPKWSMKTLSVWNELKGEFTKSDEKKIYDDICKYYNIKDHHELMLRDSLKCRLKWNIDLPTNVSISDIQKYIDKMTQVLFTVHGIDRQSMRLANGPVLFKLLESFNNNSNEFILFSGHDYTLVPLLIALNNGPNNIKWPEYGSSLIFELWLKNDIKYIRVLYDKKVYKINGNEFIKLTDLQEMWRDIAISHNFWLNSECLCL